MANLTGPAQAFVGNTSAVDTSASEILGKRAWDETGNEFIYLQGASSTVAGDWIVYDESYATTRLVANEVGPVAIAMAAIDATTKYGWYQIFGKNTIARTDTIAADKSLYVDGTAGRVDDLGVAGDIVIGAYSMTADTSNVATVYITYPHVSDDLGGGVTSAGGSDTQVQFNDGGTSLGGDAGFTYNKTTDVGSIGGLLVTGLTASELVATDASKNLQSLAVATYPSLTELTYVKGVTSAIQTQLGLKAPLASPTFTGTVTLPVGLTGVLRADTGVVAVDSDVTDIVASASETVAGKVELATDAETITGTDTARAVTPANIQAKVASDTAKGIVELATIAETTTGTDATRAVTPDGLAGSDYGKRVVGILVVDAGTDTATGSAKAFFRIPSAMNGWNLVGVASQVFSTGTTGVTLVQVRNVTDTTAMLSTGLTVDSTETDSSTAATAAVINGAADDVATADKIAIDVNAVHTTAAKGLFVELVFQLP